MSPSPSFSILFLLLPLLTAATTLTFLAPPALLPSLPPSTTAHLTTLNLVRTAPLSRTGHFTFRNLTTGSYLLTVDSQPYVWAPLRVDVDAGGETTEVFQTKFGIEWDNKGVELKSRPVELQVVGKKEYYAKREGFSPMSLLKNPMILLALVSVGIMFGMPYLMENMDPETRAEFEEQSKKGPLGGGAKSSLQNFDMAAWMAGAGSSAAGSGAAANVDAGRGGAGGGRRR